MTAAAGQLVLMVVILAGAAGVGAAADTTPTTSKECQDVIGKLTDCLTYVEGKATSPTAGCCGVVKTTVQNSAGCLCQFIAMVHQGSPQVKSLGIQEAKVSQLPSSCGLHNVSSSNCSNIAPTSSPGASSNVTTGNVAYKMHITLPLEALVLLAMIAFLLPFSNGLGFAIFV